MKRLFILVVILAFFSQSMNARTVISYTYDNAGNRISRNSSIELAIVRPIPPQNVMFCSVSRLDIMSVSRIGCSGKKSVRSLSKMLKIKKRV